MDNVTSIRFGKAVFGPVSVADWGAKGGVVTGEFTVPRKLIRKPSRFMRKPRQTEIRLDDNGWAVTAIPLSVLRDNSDRMKLKFALSGPVTVLY